MDISSLLSESARTRLKRLFKKLDTDKDGYILPLKNHFQLISLDIYYTHKYNDVYHPIFLEHNSHFSMWFVPRTDTIIYIIVFHLYSCIT